MAVGKLTGQIVERDINRLVLTPRYWALLGSPTPGTPQYYAVLDLEIEQRISDFDAAYRELDAQIRRWSDLATYVVLDTSFFCQGEFLVLLIQDPAALPERYPTTTAAGNLSLKKFTKAELADLYKQLVAGLVLAAAKEAFAVAPGVNEIRIVAMRYTPADAYGKVRPEAILATQIVRPALNGVQWTKTDALTILNEISSELITRIAGPSKGFAPLDLQTEPEIAGLIDLVTPR
jgi:hypothetical protein